MRRLRQLGAALVAASALLLLSACAGSAPIPDAAPDASPAAPVLRPITQERLQEFLAAEASALGVPGAVALLRTPGGGEMTATYGVRAIGGGEPVTVDDHIRVGSNTKTMTGTVILQLVEEGRIALDDPLSEYRPDIAGAEEITIADMLLMRSGLTNYSETYALNAGLDADPARAWDPEELIALGASLPRDFAPGTAYHYSNTNTVLLGRIAEQLEGKPLADILRERLFEPHGLDETSLPAADDTSLPEPFAHGYMFTDNVMTLASSRLAPDLLAAAGNGTLAPNDQTHANPSWAWAAGGVVSTARDLADWVEVLVGGGALDDDTQAARLASLQPTSDAPDAPRYGYNLAEMGAFLGHTGELPGYNSFMGHEPRSGVTLVIWANLAPAATGVDPATTMAKNLFGELFD